MVGDFGDKFGIDGVTGVVSTLVSLDREEEWEYNLQIEARDSSPTNPLTTITNLTITVDDVNDNQPKFIKDRYLVHIPYPVQSGKFTTNIVFRSFYLMQKVYFPCSHG